MLTLFIVDDNQSFRRELIKILENQWESIRFIEAGTIAEAQTKLARATPDLLLLDIRLPDGSGLKLARTLKQNHPGLPILIVTGYNLREYRQQARKIGVDGFIVKDRITVKTLMDPINRCLKPVSKPRPQSQQHNQDQRRTIGQFAHARAWGGASRGVL